MVRKKVSARNDKKWVQKSRKYNSSSFREQKSGFIWIQQQQKQQQYQQQHYALENLIVLKQG